MRLCFDVSVSLLLLVVRPPIVQPRSQRTRRQQQGVPVDAAQEAWAQRLSTFDATSGERMWEANNALQHGDLREACTSYEYLHRGLRGQPVSLDRQHADVIAERRALALPVAMKRDTVRDLLAQKEQLERRAAEEAGQQGRAVGEYKLEVTAEQHRLFGTPSEVAALREILSNSSRAWWTGFCDYCHPSHIGQLGNRHVTSPLKLRHDAEQLAYLLVEGKLPSYFWTVVTAFLSLSETIAVENPRASAAAFEDSTRPDGQLYPIPFDAREEIFLYYNTFIHSPLPVNLENGGWAASAISSAFDFALARERYHAHAAAQGNDAGLVVADNFLSPTALQALRTVALESTIFYDARASYLGAYLHNGLGGALQGVLPQLVAELRAGFPDIIGNLTLQNFWCYKYESGGAGIQVHADDAEVNLNFWVTPDESNTDLSRGGLVVFHQEPERSLEENGEKKWQFGHYNRHDPSAHSDSDDVIGLAERQHPFLKGSTHTAVSYRHNRLTMFKSTLLHASDGAQTFRTGYKHRRINFTLLFGSRSALHDDWGGVGTPPGTDTGSMATAPLPNDELR